MYRFITLAKPLGLRQQILGGRDGVLQIAAAVAVNRAANVVVVQLHPNRQAGGYAAQGIAGSFIVKIVGSYSNVVGLPLYEVTTLLSGEGYPIRLGWLNLA